jgi:hypothetical protein
MTNARVAGFTFLFYIAVGITQMIVSQSIPGAEDTAAKLANIAQHAAQVRINMMLGVLTGFIALTLGVALYGITRDEDHELAMLALSCRIGEGLLIVIPTLATLGLLWLATGGAIAQSADGAHALAGYLQKVKGWNVTIGATFFAVGSTIFSWLLLRGRIVPAPLASLGVVASLLVVVGLPAQLLGLVTGPAVNLFMWLPMLAFEITLALWLIIKGARMPPARQSSPAHPS